MQPCPSLPLLFLSFLHLLSAFNVGPRVQYLEKFLEFKLLVGEFYSIVDIKINTFMNTFFDCKS